MEKKNLIFALILSIAVITIYQLLFTPKKPFIQPQTDSQLARQAVNNEELLKKKPPSETENVKSGIESIDLSKEKTSTITPAKILEDIRAESTKKYIIKTDFYTAVFSNKGASLESFILERYRDDAKPDQNKLDLVAKEAEITGLYPFHFYNNQYKNLIISINLSLFKSTNESTIYLSNQDKKEIIFKFSDLENKIYVKKTYTFYGDSYVIDFDYEISYQNNPIKAAYVFGPKIGNNLKEMGKDTNINYEIGSFCSEGSKFENINKFRKITDKRDFAFLGEKEKRERIKFSDPKSTIFSGRADWVAFSQNYFTAMFKTDYSNSSAEIFFVTVQTDNDKINIYPYLMVKNPISLYLGPKDASILNETAKKHNFNQPSEVISLGWFGFISKLLRDGIIIIYKTIPNYGWAIVLLTIFLRIILFPLTLTSSKSMAKMQTLQPKIKAIKKKYKNSKKDPEQRKQMNVETMALYKQEKVNPASGCFPMLLQMPILFGFFTLLRKTIEVRHEPWILWIKDLSLKDPLFILPIAMGVTQIIVQKLSPTSADANQKKMAYIMPVFFVFICLNLPSGLTLYWFISNLLMIFQQKITNNLIFKQKKVEEKEKKLLKKKRGR